MTIRYRIFGRVSVDRYAGSIREAPDYFGKERVVPIYIEVEDGIRLERAIGRERQQREPHYEEMCRRFLADAADFSEEKLLDAQITVRFANDDLKQTEENIRDYILSQND